MRTCDNDRSTRERRSIKWGHVTTILQKSTIRLTSQYVRATGARTNRVTKHVPCHKCLKKTVRGNFDYRCDGVAYVAKWNDNSIVHVCYSTVLPVLRCTRRINWIKPNLISQYNNKVMGGVDLMDRLLATYRPSIHGKKWCYQMVLLLFTNMMNITIVTARKPHWMCVT